MSERKEHPVIWGLVALVTVSASLGLILGVGALAASRLAGIDGNGSGSSAGAGESMYLPSPSKTVVSSSESASSEASTKPKKKKRTKSAAAAAITLTAGQSSVAAMQQIDLTGRYPGGDGAILQVQRLDGKRWVDFPVTTSVSGDTFSTYIQTGRPGANKFRVSDTDAGKVSNRVSVTIG